MKSNVPMICPQCGKPMTPRKVIKVNCSASAEFIETPCPGNEPTTDTPLEGSPTEEFDGYYCAQCDIHS